MLLNDFFTYTVIEKSDAQLKASIKLNPTHNIYNGHFPGMPITPGVVQVQIIKEILNDSVLPNVRLQSARDIKFLNFINPENITDVELTLDFSPETEKGIPVNAVLHADGVKYLKMRTTFVSETAKL